MSTARICIRADASADIGSGHVMRCLTLGNELARHGAHVSFLCRAIPPALADMVRRQGHEIHILPPVNASMPNDFSAYAVRPHGVANHRFVRQQWCKRTQGPQICAVEPDRYSLPMRAGSTAQRCGSCERLPYARWLGVPWSKDAGQVRRIVENNGGADWLIVDHYALDARWEQQMRSTVDRIMVIDDLADRPHDCDLLLDQTPGRTPEDYCELVSPHVRLLTGPQYVLLRPEFAKLRPSSIARRKKRQNIERILLSLGGNAPLDIYQAALKAIASTAPPDIVVDFAAGVINIGRSDLSNVAEHMPQKIVFHGLDADMAQLMHDADLAIGAGGMSALERCCLGVPSIILILAENQRQNSLELEQNGCVRLVEVTESDFEDRMKKYILRFFVDLKGTKRMSRCSYRFIASLQSSTIITEILLGDDSDVIETNVGM